MSSAIKILWLVSSLSTQAGAMATEYPRWGFKSLWASGPCMAPGSTETRVHYHPSIISSLLWVTSATCPHFWYRIYTAANIIKYLCMEQFRWEPLCSLEGAGQQGSNHLSYPQSSWELSFISHCLLVSLTKSRNALMMANASYSSFPTS